MHVRWRARVTYVQQRDHEIHGTSARARVCVCVYVCVCVLRARSCVYVCVRACARACLQPVAVARHAEVSEQLSALQSRGAEYLASVAARKQAFEHIIELSKKYGRRANEYTFAADDLEEDLAEPIAPDALAAVAEMAAKVEGLMRPKLYAITEIYNELNAMATELIEAGESEAFARYSPQTLYDRLEKIDATTVALEARLAELKAVRAAARARRGLCWLAPRATCVHRPRSWRSRRMRCAASSRMSRAT